MFNSSMFGCLAALASVVFGSSWAQAAPREIMIQHDTFGSVPLLAPYDEPRAFVIYLMDGEWNSKRREEVEQIVSQGAAVVPLSTQAVIGEMEAGADPNTDCDYVLGEFEDLSTAGQRALGSASYRWPVLFGNGAASGTLAYLAIAQAPANTVAGAVSIGFDPAFRTRRPLCPGAKATAGPVGGFTYGPPAALAEAWVLIAPSEPSMPTKDFLSAGPNTSLQIVSTDPKAQLDVGIQSALDMEAPLAAGLSDLPLIELAASTQTSKLAIFLSGDGGWRDLDKTIAETMSRNGINVVGIDSLRYFWTQKGPTQIAHDLERIIAHYRQRWRARSIALLGYSMGADVIPPAWSNLSERTRNDIGLIVLIGLEPTAIYEISIAGYLGVNGDAEIDIRPDLKALPASKVMCFYGTEEKDDGDTACTLAELSGATLRERPGGHHLDGNYDDVAKDILDRMNSIP